MEIKIQGQDMEKKCALFLLIFITINLNTILYAQKVGLVLSGGGAKGMAHVGVLRALEENDIPIDYIAGTSIGAIVGGLYASGYTPDEIEKLLTSEQFETWSKGVIEDKYQFFSKKEEDNAEITSLKFRVDSVTKTYLPSNVIEPYQIDFAFMQILAAPAAAANYNFDSLMIPFRCVASDVFLHKAVYFRKGNLAAAIRASMTFPLYFKPIRIEGRLLFDGGIYDNFPKDVMINDFNPDFIIGVKVSSNSEEPEDDDLLSQLENMIAMQTDFSLPAAKSILLEPKIYGLGLTDFRGGSSTSQIGYDTAMHKMNEIKQLISRRESPEERKKKREKFKHKIPELHFNNIEIQGLRPRQEKYIINLLSKKKEIIGIDKLKEQYFKLLAGGQISSLSPEAIFDSITQVFDLKLTAKKAKKFKAGLGGNISSSILNEGYLGLSYRYFFARAYKFSGNVYFGKFYNAAQFSGRVDFATSTPWFAETAIAYNRWNYSISSPEYFFEDKKSPYIIVNEFIYRAEAGIPIKINGKLTSGIVWAYNSTDYFQSRIFYSYDKPDVSAFNFRRYFLKYTESTLNRIIYADRGIYFSINANYIKGNETHTPGTTALNQVLSKTGYDYWNSELDYTNNFRLSKHFTLGYKLNLYWSNQKIFSNYTATVIQAKPFEPFPYIKALFNDDFRAQKYAAAGPIAIYRFTDLIQFRLEAYIFQPYRDLSPETTNDFRFIAHEGKPFDSRFYCGNATLVYHSIVGPVSIGYNYYQNNGNNNFYLIFNLGFFVFNRNAYQ